MVSLPPIVPVPPIVTGTIQSVLIRAGVRWDMARDLPIGYASVIHSLRLEGDPQPMAVTYGIKFTDGTDVSTPVAAQSAVSSINDVFASGIMGSIMQNSYSLVQTELHYKSIANGPTNVAVRAVTAAGVGNSQCLPQNCALLLHKRTNVAGRRGRGRIYLPGVPEAVVFNNGTLQAPYPANTQGSITQWLALLNNVAEVDYMVLLHSTSTAIPTIAGLPLPYRVTEITLDSTIATQRQRLRR